MSLDDARALGLNVDFFLQEFTLGSPGDVDLEVQWTFPSNDIDLALLRGSCSLQAVRARQCATIVESTSITAKPERVTAPGLAAGTYTVLVVNNGPGAESGTGQIGVTR